MRAEALVLIGLSAIACAQVGDAVDSTRKSIQIQPGALLTALPTFGEVEDLHMVFLPDDIGNQNTSGVSGSLTHAEALEQLLRGTDLTYRFLEAHTIVILPARLAGPLSVEPTSATGSEDETGQAIDAPVGPVRRMAQVTITAPSDTQQLEYFRLLAAMSRSDYERQASALPFVDVGTVRFPAGNGPEHRLPLGQHIQTADVDGLVLWRVLNLTKNRAISELQVHNSNSFPVFVEIDFEPVALGRGPYAALAPGETAVWTWAPRRCISGLGAGIHDGPALPGTGRLADWDCDNYIILPGVARVRVVKDWDPGVQAPARPPGS